MLNRLFKKNNVHLQRNKFMQRRKVPRARCLAWHYLKLQRLPFYVAQLAQNCLNWYKIFVKGTVYMWCTFNKNVVVIVEFLFDVVVAHFQNLHLQSLNIWLFAVLHATHTAAVNLLMIDKVLSYAILFLWKNKSKWIFFFFSTFVSDYSHLLPFHDKIVSNYPFIISN